jgi:5-methylcytosine-specific restriction endonuclease McrA
MVRIYRSERRERCVNQSDGTVTKTSLMGLPKDFCAICGDNLKWEVKNSVHLDHITPLIKGGLHSISNLQWTCAKCNLKKGGR